MRKRLVAAAGVTLSLSIGWAAGPSTSVQAAPTPFGFSASSYATRVVGGQLPTNSGKTAQSVLQCTTEAPRTDKNRLAEVALGGLPLDVGAGRNENRSEAISGGFRAFSVSSVDEVFIGSQSPRTGLLIEGLKATAIGSYVNGNPRPAFYSTFARATLFAAGLPVGNVPIADVRDGFAIPGVATVTLNGGSTKTGTQFNSATGNALLIELNVSGSKVVVASAYARIDRVGSMKVFGGGAKVARAVIDNGTARVGPVMNLPMPCLGTSGEWKSESLAKGQLDGVGTIKAGRTRVFGEQANGSRLAITEAYVESVNLADGALRIEGVKSRSYAKLNAEGEISRKAEGSTIGRIVAEGEVIALPDPGETILVPGLARITFLKVRRFPTGIEVVVLRIELLEDGNVVDIASTLARIA